MPRPMAEALKWPDVNKKWSDLLSKLGSTNWSTQGKPEWGAFKVGMTDPAKSTAGLLALMALLDANDDGEVTADERSALLSLKKSMTLYKDSTQDIFAALRSAQDETEALKTISAFPALEQDIIAFNKTNPPVPLAAIYPTNNSADADHPYLILESPWSSAQHKAVASAFLQYARGSVGRAAFLNAGFRDANRTGGGAVSEANGTLPEVPTLPRAVLLPESVKFTLESWTAVTRPTNILLVIDTSGSMGEQVAGLGKSTLDLTKAAATDALKLFDQSARVGLWAFSTATAGQDFRALVPVGPLNDPMPSGTDRRTFLTNQINALQANGRTGLYNTVWAAHEQIAHQFQANSTNLVVVLTDGADDNNVTGLSKDDLISKLSAASTDPTKRVPVIMVGIGPNADPQTLADISGATDSLSYGSQMTFDINQVLMTAIFGRVS
jgi:Ca-activated chloride channel homolog